MTRTAPRTLRCACSTSFALHAFCHLHRAGRMSPSCWSIVVGSAMRMLIIGVCLFVCVCVCAFVCLFICVCVLFLFVYLCVCVCVCV